MDFKINIIFLHNITLPDFVIHMQWFNCVADAEYLNKIQPNTSFQRVNLYSL